MVLGHCLSVWSMEECESKGWEELAKVSNTRRMGNRRKHRRRKRKGNNRKCRQRWKKMVRRVRQGFQRCDEGNSKQVLSQRKIEWGQKSLNQIRFVESAEECDAKTRDLNPLFRCKRTGWKRVEKGGKILNQKPSIEGLEECDAKMGKWIRF